MSLNENLQKVVARYDELGDLMMAPGAAASGDYAKMSKEYADLAPVVDSSGFAQRTAQGAEVDHLAIFP